MVVNWSMLNLIFHGLSYEFPHLFLNLPEIPFRDAQVHVLAQEGAPGGRAITAVHLGPWASCINEFHRKIHLPYYIRWNGILYLPKFMSMVIYHEKWNGVFIDMNPIGIVENGRLVIKRIWVWHQQNTWKKAMKRPWNHLKMDLQEHHKTWPGMSCDFLQRKLGVDEVEMSNEKTGTDLLPIAKRLQRSKTWFNHDQWWNMMKLCLTIKDLV